MSNHHHRQTLSFAEQGVDVDGGVQESIKLQLKVHFEATNVSFLIPGERYKWSKVMSGMVEGSDDDTLKNSALPIAINKSEILNHSHAINAIISFLSLDDMDFYLHTENFVETINQDGGVKLNLSSIYSNHLAIEVW